MIKIVIVEDHKLMRDNLKFLFSIIDDFCVTGDYAKGEDFIAALPSLSVDVVLLDFILKDSPMPMQGDDVARYLRRERPDIKVVMVSGENNLETLQKMLDAGIDGFVSKEAGCSDSIAEAIRSVMNGSKYYTQDMSSILAKIADNKQKKKEISGEFTEQEHRILELCGEGLQGKEIADRLNISVNTVYNHKRSIYKKAGLNNNTEAVVYAVNNNLIRL